MNILVTGGAGFIGSNFIRLILNDTAYRVINLDLLTYAGNLENLADIAGNERYRFIRGDICDSSLVNEIFDIYEVDTVVNFAAESHVDRSIEDPGIFIKTNIMGTMTLIEAARKKWKTRPFDKYDREYREGVKFLQVSTDEVYGSIGSEGYFTEDSHISPNSPYSASKASADMFVRAYWMTYGLPMNITRCSNNFGPYQHPEKLLPLIINNALKDKNIPVYGDGKQVRDWLYVEDHCKALRSVIEKGKNGEIYNIGGNNEVENIDLVTQVLRYLGKSVDLISFVSDRPGHDRKYAIDSSKLSRELGWRPSEPFGARLRSSIDWYIENKEWLENIISGDYKNYYERMYKA
jgi:dTDP-glucose 4,6-dehydratase